MTTLPNMSLVLPTRGAGGAGIWDDAIDAALGLVDEHNHTSGKGLRVPTTGININADLTFSSLYAPTNLHRISFASVAALAANNKSLFVSDADNELYWRSNAGTNVKLTSGSSLNVAAFTGGFGGDYVSASAAAAFDDANKNYTFKSSGSAWARATFGGIRLIEFGTTETVRVGLLCPAGLGASYDVTWPLAVPGSKALVQSSTAGVLTFENTGVESVTMATNASVTVSGTGDYKHGDFTRISNVVAMASAIVGGNWVEGIGGSNEAFMISGASATLVASIDLRVGDRLKSISFKIFGDGAADLTTTVFHVSSSMVGTSIGTTTSTNPAASWATVTIDVTDTTVASLEAVNVHFVANAANIRVGNFSWTYDHP